MALRVFLQRCLSTSSKTLSVPLPLSYITPGLGIRTPLCRLISNYSLDCGDLRAPARIRTFSTSPACPVTFNVQDDDDFDERVKKSTTPVIVDFHAQWCGPCKILAPRLERLVAQLNGKVRMAKVDIDDHTDLALQYEVSAVPTVMAVKDGEVVDKFVGLKDDDQLEAFLKKLVG
ncbi:thioredoxin, mitochondrial [Ambystoma mexicanum]|uniref:thioredoxin, mitochondrial n=1 Tax=Ambystoma mexicanum TaxID=8296 RepID=UPI0037E981E8